MREWYLNLSHFLGVPRLGLIFDRPRRAVRVWPSYPLSLSLHIHKDTMLGRRYIHLLLQFAFLFILHVNAKSATGDRVLVIHEEDTVQQTFSQFFASLKGLSFSM